MNPLKRTYRQFSLKRKADHTIEQCERFAFGNQLKTAEFLNVFKYKSSDTLCVLASGSSINDITPDQWQFIKENDSLGFNNWLLHSYVPTFFFYETDANTERHRWLNELKFDNLAARSKDYCDTPIIFHYQPKRYFDIDKLIQNGLIDNLYLQASFSLPGEDQATISYAIEQADDVGLLNRVFPCVYKRGSLTRILHFASAARYKNVVFFGADLVGSDYFFDTYSEEDLPSGTQKPDLKQYLYQSANGLKSQNTVHMTMDPTVHPLTMLDVLDIFMKQLGNTKGMKLYTGSKKSALYGQYELVDKLMISKSQSES